MTQCKCEHWEECHVCMPHRFNSDGTRKPPEPVYELTASAMREAIRQRDSAQSSAEEWFATATTLRTAALLALGLLWMTERQSDKVHRAYTTLRDALGGKEALREGIQAALNAGHEADHPPGADWWAGKKDTAGAKCSHCTDNECTLKCLTAPADGVPVAGKKTDRG